MKTEMQTLELVAIEESSLESVSGGGDLSFPSLDITKTVQVAIDVDLNKQTNSIDFTHNTVNAVGPALFQFSQQNVNGGKAA